MANLPITTAYKSGQTLANPIGAVPSSADLTEGIFWEEIICAGGGDTVSAFNDIMVSGKFKTGASPSPGVVEILIVGVDFGGGHPGTADFTGDPGPFTGLNRNAIDNAIQRVVIETNGDTGGVYDFGPFSVRELFGGILPRRVIIALTHNTGVNSDAFSGYIGYETTLYNLATP